MTATAIPVPTAVIPVPEIPDQAIAMESDYGLVSPEGVFYPCKFCGHSSLGRSLGAYEKGYFKPGWIHVDGHNWDFEDLSEKMNQKQIDCAFAWALVNPRDRNYSRINAIARLDK